MKSPRDIAFDIANELRRKFGWNPSYVSDAADIIEPIVQQAIKDAASEEYANVKERWIEKGVI